MTHVVSPEQKPLNSMAADRRCRFNVIGPISRTLKENAVLSPTLTAFLNTTFKRSANQSPSDF